MFYIEMEDEEDNVKITIPNHGKDTMVTADKDIFMCLFPFLFNFLNMKNVALFYQPFNFSLS